jgi:uncharacterized membrane protein YbaN (DUF454 family)
MPRFAFLVAGLVFVGLALIGAMLPVMPSTVFLILAAACFARSSPRLEAWLLGHPRFGPLLRDWRQRGAIPRPAKRLAVLGMAMGFIVTVALRPGLPVITMTAAVLLAAGLFVTTRPD